MDGSRDEATALLADVRSWRDRTREDRHGYAFPLFLFGALILFAPVLYAAPYNPVNIAVPEERASNALVQIFRTHAGTDPYHPNLIAWYWLLTVVGGLLVSAWWYRRRALRVGVATDTRAFLLTAAVAVAGFLIGVYALADAAVRLYGTPSVNVPLLLGSAAAAAVAGYWSTRPSRTAPQRLAGVFVTALCGTVAFTAVGVYVTYGFSALLVIAAALLALAWLERSVLLGTVGVLFVVAVLPATFQVPYDIQFVFWHLGWRTNMPNRQLEVLQLLVLPATILLAGGVLAALTRPKARVVSHD